jgi:threonine/homoserine/homoserine lactone efflux protein
MQILGYYLEHIPILPHALVVAGGVTIVYFAFSLALQRGELPVIARLQKLIESKMHEKTKQDDKAKASEKKDSTSAQEEQ